MRVAPIDHHWWYDHRLSTYGPRLVGHTRVDWLTEPLVQGEKLVQLYQRLTTH